MARYNRTGQWAVAASLPLLLMGASPAPYPPPSTVAPSAQPAPAASGDMVTPEVDRSLNRLAVDIDRQLAPPVVGKKGRPIMKIVVLGFANMNGQITGLGEWVAEELITRLFATRHYDIPDSYFVRQVMEWNKMSQSGLTRPSTIQQFRKLLGAQDVVFGTASDLGTAIRLNVRIYRTDRGSLVGVASAELPATTGLVNLYRQVDPQLRVQPTPTRRPPTTKASPSANVSAAPEETFWATSARASSEYNSEGWSADRVTGPPDTPACGDFSTAWAPKEPNAGTEWLEVGFASKVLASSIHVRETFNPGTVVKIESITNKGASLLWQGQDPTSECPGELIVKLSPPVPVEKLRVTLDTGKATGFPEIDAIGVVGQKQ